VSDVGVADGAVGRLGVEAIALDEELREWIRRCVERFAGRPGGRLVAAGASTGVAVPALEPDAAVARLQRDPGVV
jgi:hypothetical protein